LFLFFTGSKTHEEAVTQHTHKFRHIYMTTSNLTFTQTQAVEIGGNDVTSHSILGSSNIIFMTLIFFPYSAGQSRRNPN